MTAQQATPSSSSATVAQAFDAVIVGAGFGGMYALHRLRALGLRVKVFEAGGDVGGTWYWNRYPGARCDVHSVEYSYSFSDGLEQAWVWSERYATQPEILRYINHVADRFDLRRDIQLHTRVTAAAFDENAGRWVVTTEDGQQVHAQFCLMATGCLSAARTPQLPGLETFRGQTWHTGAWPHEGVDFAGQRVGVIGTGSSGIQSIPLIAVQAAHLHVFQRTPNFVVPARNTPLKAEYVASVKQRYAELRSDVRAGVTVYAHGARGALEVSEEERLREYESRWQTGGYHFIKAFPDLLLNAGANQTATAFAHGKIRAIVKDPAVAAQLLPLDHPIGTKRLCVGTDYYETYNRANVSLVNLREAPMQAITPSGVVAGGVEYPLDALVFATGFDAMTGALLAMDIRGRGGRSLREAWADGPATYLGMAVAGFPNLFTITGPGSPSVLSNMIMSIEQHVEWMAGSIAHMRRAGLGLMEAQPQAQADWVRHVNEVADGTLYPTANSWYLGANVPGKPRVFMPYVGGVGPYRQRCDRIAADGYAGFTFSTGSAQAVKGEAALAQAA